MKLLTEKKTIDYFGIQLQVNAAHNFIATDYSGTVYTFSEQPEITGSVWYVDGQIEDIADVDLEGLDWRETLKAI